MKSYLQQAGSLRARLMILILLALLPVIVLEIDMARRARAAAKAEVRDIAFRMTRILASKQQAVLESARQFIVTLEQVDPVKHANFEACQPLFDRLLRYHPLYINLALVDQQGNVLCTARPPAEPEPNLSERSFFQRSWATDGFAYGIDLGQLGAGRSLAVSRVVETTQGKLLLVVVIDFQADHLFRQHFILPRQSTMVILRQDGRYLLRYPDPTGTSSGDPSEHEDLIRKASSGIHGIDKVDEDGIFRSYSVEKLALSGSDPLYVAIGVPPEAIPFQDQLWKQIIVTSGLTLVALFGAWFLGSRWIVRPTRHLVEVAEEFSQGNLNRRSSPDSLTGEFEVIGAAFNRVADIFSRQITDLKAARADLEQSQSQLEERVHLRTQELHQTQERLIDAIESMDASFVMLDSDQKVLLYNQKLYTFFGISRDRHYIGLPGPRILTDFVEAGETVTGYEGKMDVWLRDRLEAVHAADGRVLEQQFGKRWLAMSEHRMRDGGLVSIATDITRQMHVRRALEATAVELQRSNEELERFAYIASHDLQEPLRMVASYTQLLSRRYGEQLDDTAREYLAFALDGANRMRDLIRHLLEYSRIATQGQAFKPVRPEEVIEEVLRDQEMAIRESGAQIHLRPIPAVMADRVQLYQVFANLISNAIRFAGPRPPEITLSGRALPHSEVEITVSDRGIGFPEGQIGRAFEMFARFHNKEEYPGTGIGLPVCKRIIERHGGAIEIESEEGSGTTIRFTLPKGPSEPIQSS